MDSILIESIDDPRIADYAQIRERDLTGRDDKFIAEGKVTLSVLIRRSRFAIDSVLLGTSRLLPLSDILHDLPEHVPVYTAPQHLLDKIAGFPIHRGILACGRKGKPLKPTDLIPERGSSRLLMLNNVSNHDNVGAAFRNAAAFGADGVVLDDQSCDPLYRKSIRVSAGAALWLPFVHGGKGAVQIAAFKDAGYTVWAMTPRADAAALASLSAPERLVILLGAEGPGLPDALMNEAVPVRIPMTRAFDSVNVATAGAIALSYVFDQRS